MTHDSRHHDTTLLFAALDVKTGLGIGECLPRHLTREFLKFLRSIDKAELGQREARLVLDNQATRKRPDVKAWLKLAKLVFAEITLKHTQRGCIARVDHLKAAIYYSPLQHNAKPKFKSETWIKTVEDILKREAEP